MKYIKFCPDGTKKYYKNNLLHRIDGPAIEYRDEDKEWWINGIWYGSVELSIKDQIILDKWIDSFGVTYYEVLDEDGTKATLPDIPGFLFK